MKRLRMVASGKLAMCDICDARAFSAWCAGCQRRVCDRCSETREYKDADGEDYEETNCDICLGFVKETDT